ncbi:MAG: hypothetical protein HGA41_02895 [Syntrophaceae bacterium]|jgi:hypothetical protein|nr:hypothetical protein [Syntrophaceae bacterium]
MGKSMYDFGNQAKEKARQQKQIDKASRRIMAKQQKANIKTSIPNRDSDIVEPGLVEEIVKSIA